MRKQLGKALFKLSGWTYENDPTVWSDKQVAIGFEHTSNRDGVLALSLVQIAEVKNPHTLIKKELFKGPFKYFFEALGCIPVDRQSSSDIVGQMTDRFAQEKTFTLMIAPEATRAKGQEARKPIKTGFWHIAKAANVPIVLMYANPRTKHGGTIAKLMPTNLQDDLLIIQRLYKEKGIDIVIPESN